MEDILLIAVVDMAASRAGHEAFMADPERLAPRARLGGAAPSTRVLDVHE
ncbi:hypothetical protein Ade02nite_56460 [Paractinoplanes deccanensis]|uniref:Uncharacterized protein n=1 Tax=Paractinoplanes deccanensis TaxID=113561 RepID=A0ABQ3YAP7_9ACTN|nr:hypothetical protein [Actinoplanes deccanensis]GID77005.1 hypothetical protein Ade02nite_56460 [Actinoplanes deccanensis]